MESGVADSRPVARPQLPAIRNATSRSTFRHSVEVCITGCGGGLGSTPFPAHFLPILLAVVLFYQVAGTLGEWAMVGSFFRAVQDFRIGVPGMGLQVAGGYLLLKYSLQ